MALLGVTAAGTLTGRWAAGRIVATVAGIGAAITGGGALGWAVAYTGSAAAITAAVGVGASVISYRILEELLREAHHSDTGPAEVGVLYGAFLPFFLSGIAAG